jgi:hypothetical protein
VDDDRQNQQYCAMVAATRLTSQPEMELEMTIEFDYWWQYPEYWARFTACPYYSISALPYIWEDAPGVYALYLTPDKCVEVGQARINLRRRIKQHDGFDQARAIIVYRPLLYEVEWRMAYVLRPLRGWHGEIFQR